MQASAISQAGLQNAYDRFANSAERTVRAGAKADYAREVTEQISARREARANLAAMKTADQMTARLLDLVV